jgi:hypothetical protein
VSLFVESNTRQINLCRVSEILQSVNNSKHSVKNAFRVVLRDATNRMMKNSITTGIRAFAECHALCRVLFSRALDKEAFAESRTRQSPALGNELVYRVQDTRHRNTLGKDIFDERRTLDKGGARQRAVSGRLKLTAVNLCRVPNIWHSAKISLPSGHSAKHMFIF